MALEKAAKAHFWNSPGVSGESTKVNRSHRVAEKFLPTVYKAHWFRSNGGTRIPGSRLKAIRRLCQEVDLLAPAVSDGTVRQDNCEYPWEVVDGIGLITAVLSPLDHEFAPSTMVQRPGVAGFLKVIRASVATIARQGEQR